MNSMQTDRLLKHDREERILRSTDKLANLQAFPEPEKERSAVHLLIGIAKLQLNISCI